MKRPLSWPMLRPPHLGRAVGWAGLAVGLGWLAGGGWALGRVDPALLIPTFALVAALIPAQPVLGAGVLTAAAALFALALGDVGSDISMLVMLAIELTLVAFAAAAAQTLMGAIGAWCRVVVRWRRLVTGTARASAALLWWVAAHAGLALAYAPAAATADGDGRLLVLSGLPLALADPDHGHGPDGPPLDAVQALVQGRAGADAPWTARLRGAGARYVDGFAPGTLRADDRLLLVHPRALPPLTLAAIDAHVRRGGRTVVLADGWSSWPAPFALGDPRNPPVTSLLTPLLDHWGIDLAVDDLAPTDRAWREPRRWRMQGGWRVNAVSAGRFVRHPAACRVIGRDPDGRAAVIDCAIGAHGGRAVLVSDADLLLSKLWQPQPVWAHHLRPTDTMEWLEAQLVVGTAGSRPMAMRLRQLWRR